MRREGSPWQGLGVVFLKELSDHLTGTRMFVLEWLVVVTAAVAVYFSIEQIRETVAEDPFLYLLLFIRAREPLPSLVELLTILLPVVAIGLGFDLVNGEHNGRTLSRILAQPIYRDALLLGKFLAGLATITISLVTLWLLVIGFGLLQLGIPPGGEEMARCLTMLAVTIIYGGVWLALAMLCSIVFRSPAAAGLVPLGLWLFLTFLWPRLASGLADGFTSADDVLGLLDARLAFSRLSPSALFGEIASFILVPSYRSAQEPVLAKLGLALVERGALRGTPLPFVESLLIVWAQIVGLAAATILLFVAGYVTFQRQEVRA